MYYHQQQALYSLHRGYIPKKTFRGEGVQLFDVRPMLEWTFSSFNALWPAPRYFRGGRGPPTLPARTSYLHKGSFLVMSLFEFI